MRWSFGLVFAVLVVGFAVYKSRPMAVAITVPEQREVIELVIASGRFRAERQSGVGAEVNGLVEEVRVREGDRVTQGSPLVRLRQDDLQQQLEQAKRGIEVAVENLLLAGVNRADAETNLLRAESLFARQINTQADLDAARTAVDAARASEGVGAARQRELAAALEVVGRQLAKRVIEAPFDGVVLRRFVEPGQSVIAGQELLTLAEMEAAEIYVETDENNLGKLVIGQTAHIIAPAYPDRPFTGTLTQIGPNVDFERGVVGLRLKPGPLPEFVLPNMTVDVNLEVARFTNALAVPTSSVLEKDRQASVLVLTDGHARRQAVVVLGRNPQWTAVNGLRSGDQILVQATAVADGRAVRGVSPASGARP